MALTLITGVANTGKTGRVMARLEGAARGHLEAVLLVPSSPDVRRSQLEIASRGILGITVARIDEWIDALWAQYGDGRRVVDEATRSVLVRRALGAGAEFEQTPRGDGLARLLCRIAQRTEAGWPPSADRSVEDARTVLARYREMLETQGYVERPACVRRLIEAGYSAPALVALNRFTDLSPYQELLVGDLATRSDVCVALTWDDGHLPTQALTPLVARLETAGADRETLTEGSWTATGLVTLSEALYGGETGLPAPEGLTAAEAQGGEAEGALISRLVRDLVDSGVPAGEIAVAFRRPASRINSLVDQMEAAGVKYQVDVSLQLTATPFGRALMSLLGQVGGSATREGLLGFVLSPYSGVAAEDAELADLAWRRVRLSGDELLVDAAARLPAVAPVLQLARRAVSGGMDAQRARSWQELTSTLLLEGLAKHGRDGEEAALDAAAHRRVMTAVSEMAEMDPAAPARDVIAALVETEVSVAAEERRDAVLITEAHRLLGRRFQAVVIGGLTAEEFSVERQEPLATAVLRRAGERVGIDEAQAERMLFYLLVTRAKKYLVLVRQSTDDEGHARRASAFWDEVMDLYRDSDEMESSGTPRAVRVERASLEDLAAVAPAYLTGRRAERLASRETPGAGVRRGMLKERENLEQLSADRPYSPTELETYLQCPYRWFYAKVLRPIEVDRTVDARTEGVEAHRQLRLFYERWSAVGNGRVVPGNVGVALTMLGQVQAERQAGGRIIAADLQEELGLAVADAMARAIVADDAEFLPGYAPVRHELEFGKPDAPEVEFGGVRLVGSIDRVDAGPNGVLAIDYKRSQVFGRGSFDTQGLLQAPIYAFAASSLLGRPCVGGVYRSMKSLSVRGFYLSGEVDLYERGISTDSLDSDGMKAEFERTERLIGQAVAGIRSGVIGPTPGARCDRCEARNVCGGCLK